MIKNDRGFGNGMKKDDMLCFGARISVKKDVFDVDNETKNQDSNWKYKG